MLSLERSGRYLKVFLRSVRSKMFHCVKADKSVSVAVMTGEGAAEGTTEEKIRAEDEEDERREIEQW